MYDDSRLSGRFAALAPEPLSGNWDKVLDRAGMARNGRQRFAVPSRAVVAGIVALAAVVLVVVVGAASALAVRAYVLHQGIVGLPPVGAAPSTPKSGELVLGFTFGHTFGDHGRFRVSVYADGRLISE